MRRALSLILLTTIILISMSTLATAHIEKGPSEILATEVYDGQHDDLGYLVTVIVEISFSIAVNPGKNWDIDFYFSGYELNIEDHFWMNYSMYGSPGYQTLFQATLEIFTGYMYYMTTVYNLSHYDPLTQYTQTVYVFQYDKIGGFLVVNETSYSETTYEEAPWLSAITDWITTYLEERGLATLPIIPAISIVGRYLYGKYKTKKDSAITNGFARA